MYSEHGTTYTFVAYGITELTGRRNVRGRGPPAMQSWFYVPHLWLSCVETMYSERAGTHLGRGTLQERATFTLFPQRDTALYR